MSEPLTQEQVDALPDGTVVSVLWSGGNGPHEYTVKRINGSVVAQTRLDRQFNPLGGNTLSTVGLYPLTEVRLVTI